MSKTSLESMETSDGKIMSYQNLAPQQKRRLRLKSSVYGQVSDHNRQLNPKVQSGIDALQALLRRLVYDLDSTHKQLFAVIAQPIRGQSYMRAIASDNISACDLSANAYLSNGVFLYNHRSRGSKPYRGIAGKCATLLKSILVSDVNDPTNVDAADFVVINHMRATRGILAVPVIENKNEERTCLAVVSVSSIKPNFLRETHLIQTEAFAEMIAPIMSQIIQDMVQAESTSISPMWKEESFFHIQNEDVPKHPERIAINAMPRLRPSLARLVQMLVYEERCDFILHSLRIVLLGLDAAQREYLGKELNRLFCSCLEPNDSYPELIETLERIVAQQRERSRRPPVKFMRILTTLRSERNTTITLDKLIDAGFSNSKAAQNALWELQSHLIKEGYDTEHLPAVRFHSL